MHLLRFRHTILILLLSVIFKNSQAQQNHYKTTTFPWKSLEDVTAFFKDISEKKSKTIYTTRWGNIRWNSVENSFLSEVTSYNGVNSAGKSVATLSLSATSASAVFVSGNDEYVFSVDRKGVWGKYNDVSDFLCVEEQCCHHHAENNVSTSQKAKRKYVSNANNSISDNVIREYRLAIAVGYLAASRLTENWKTYFINIVNYLNTIYMRDLGIRFVPVLDERLFNLNPSLENGIFSQDGKPMTASAIRSNGTPFINKIIGAEKYDVGVVITPSKEFIGGMAVIGAAYKSNNKANCMVAGGYVAVAHELGHMFGAQHTFINGGTQVEKTNRIESGDGTSLMSYGKTAAATRDFFNLGNIMQIREMYQKSAGYYVSEKDKPASDLEKNQPKGIITDNRAPKIDKERYQREYIIPAATSFRFVVHGTDDDSSDEFTYQVQQLNYYLSGLSKDYIKFQNPFVTKQMRELGGIPYFEVSTPKRDNTFYFQNRMYSRDYTTQISKYNYNADLFMTIFDKNPGKTDHKTMIDTMHVKINALETLTPFTLDYLPKKANYQAGEKVKITWQVDEKVVPRTDKVRIRLSADLGQSYPYILVNETDNDGEEEITLPYIPIGTFSYTAYPHQSKLSISAGAFMVEHINGICYATSEIRPVEKIKNVDKNPFPADLDPNEYTSVLGGFTIEAGTRNKNYSLSIDYPVQSDEENMSKRLNTLTILPDVVLPQNSFYLLSDFKGVITLAVTDKSLLINELTENKAYLLSGVVSNGTLAEVQKRYVGKTLDEARKVMILSADEDYITPSISLKINKEAASTSICCSAIIKHNDKIFFSGNNTLIYRAENSENASERHVTLFSIDGKRVYNTAVSIQQGVGEYRFEIAGLSRGVYIVKISGNNYSMQEKVIKR